MIAQVCEHLGLPPPLAPTEYASATVAEAAQALSELANSGATDSDYEQDAPAGLDAWVRQFEVVEVPLPDLPATRSPAIEPGGDDERLESSLANPWSVVEVGDSGFPITEIQRALRRLNSQGTLLCLGPARNDAAAIALLEAAKRCIQTGAVFAVAQCSEGGGAFARSLSLEQPKLDVRVISLAADSHAPRRIAAELAQPPGFSEIRYASDGRRFARRLRLLQATDRVTNPVPISDQDLVLVTGGGKGIAAECTLALARERRCRIAILGRSNPASDPELAANLMRFEELGARVRYLRADVNDAAAVKTVLAELNSSWGPPTIFVHGAGVNQPCPIAQLDVSALRATCAPKLQGLDNVLRCLPEQTLRLVVGFGSVIAVAGLAGEADYALANEWLALRLAAYAEQSPHCRTLTLEWSVWSGVGMGERLGRIDSLAREGVSAMTPEQGVTAFMDCIQVAHHGRMVIAGRLPDGVTLPFFRDELPLRRFLEHIRVHVPKVELIADATLSIHSDPYLADHVFRGDQLLPAVMGMEVMAQAAGALAESDARPCFEALSFARPIVIPPGGELGVRVVALQISPGIVEVAIRTEPNGFQVDHFHGRCRFDQQEPCLGARLPWSTPCASAQAHEPLDLLPNRDLYGGLLFHTGRFERIQSYELLAARKCQYSLTPAPPGNWFGAYFPQRLALEDPGARDALIHGIQACIPHDRLLPIGVERIDFSARKHGPPHSLRAIERSHDDGVHCYDVDLYGPSWKSDRGMARSEPSSDGTLPMQRLGTFIAGTLCCASRGRN